MKKVMQGFTLIELMIGMSLMLLLVCISAVNFRFLEKTFVLSEVQVLCAACYALQQQAIATNTIQELTIDIANHSYSCNGHEHALASGICFDVALQAYGPPSAPHKLLEQPSTFKDHKILFYPEGMMSAGMLCLTNSSRSLLYAISSSVAHVSFLRRYYYDGKWHLIG